ncbi:MAG: TM2 domain-containing protein [Mangrovibacterium sp.]
MKQENEKYCAECGEIIRKVAEICPKCGVRQMRAPSELNDQWLITLIFCLCLGPFGAHRFYNGHIGTGVLQLITFGGCGIWTLIDLILIIMGNFKDHDGNIISNKR